MSTTPGYRSDIDGLRAIAVLAILCFHADFSWAPGGFRGVDTFFVISGFLITGILLREREAGTLRVAGFYERRARRIVPALFAMLSVSAVVALRVLQPADLRVFAQNFVAILMFSSNILFWRRAGGFDFYFEPSAKLNPLLHTWSLGVEEQFYLVFPLLLILGWAWWKRGVFWLILAIALASLGLSLTYGGGWLTSAHLQADFYLLPFRAWQLALGALVAFVRPAPPAGRARSWLAAVLSVLGLAAVLVSIAVHLPPELLPPAALALPATLGTALLLAHARGTFVGRLLSLRPMVWVGLISYSVYLWHQPIFAFAHYISLGASLALDVSVGLCLLSLAVGAVSWWLIEVPCRDHRRVPRRAFVTGALVAAAVLVMIALPAAIRRELPMFGRLISAPALKASLTNDALTVAMRDCATGAAGLPADEFGCVIGAPAPARPSYLVIGDSHAGSLLPAFERLSAATGESGRLVALRGCPPLFDVFAEVRTCASVQERALAFARAQGIRRVYLVARWAGYTDGDYDGHIDYFLSDQEWKGSQSRISSRAAIIRGLPRTFARYGEAGIQVSVVEQVPQQRARPLGLYLQAAMRQDPRGFLRTSELTRGAHDTLQSYMSAVFGPHRGRAGVAFINLTDALCDDRACAVGTPEESYYWDVSHLSEAGARRVSDLLIAQAGSPAAR